MTVRKIRGRRWANHSAGELVEFGMEDQGRLGKFHITSITREGRDPFDITTPVTSKLTREESDTRQVVGFFGLRRYTLEIETGGVWVPLEPEPVK